MYFSIGLSPPVVIMNYHSFTDPVRGVLSQKICDGMRCKMQCVLGKVISACAMLKIEESSHGFSYTITRCLWRKYIYYGAHVL